MKERPILFSAPMVRAILDGTKSQTRRVAREAKHGESLACRYGLPGDRLWVRETWAFNPCREFGVMKVRSPDDCVYRADENTAVSPGKMLWTPSIHMPRAASRINLEVTGVRVERLQEISDGDSRAEGIEPNWIGPLDKGPNGYGGTGWTEEVGWMNYMTSADGEPCYTPRESYQSLWESINGAESWAANPWVWVVEFKRALP